MKDVSTPDSDREQLIVPFRLNKSTRIFNAIEHVAFYDEAVLLRAWEYMKE